MIKFKELRLEKGLSQSDVARQLGVTQQAYANYERGAREADYETLKKLAEIFDITVDYLLGRTEDPDHSNPLDKELEGVDFALWGEVKDMSDTQKQDILDYIRFKKSQGGK